ncbi:hypothetical protein ACVPPR_07780 [Dellaglioa sp. L3N]
MELIEVEQAVNKTSKQLVNGTIVYGIATRTEEPNQIGLKITYNFTIENGGVSEEVSATFELYYKQVAGEPYPVDSYNKLWNYIEDEAFDFAGELNKFAMNMGKVVIVIVPIGEAILTYLTDSFGELVTSVPIIP